ncbi:dynein heavy chain 1, axonemal [Elysia marginata]|uniref:Dynein heavy chain 1, axonemal n=1 Tax=Elysia marginata TaxID=1093978 RepID=A0AAV4JV52_9GAST|nr:dynein heavy chain 1, axonemal [Elysia marginata]
MAEPRGESQASGRSQYSESVVLNQDIGDLSAIEQDLGDQSRQTNSKAKSTRFNLSAESVVAMEPQADLHRQTYAHASLQAKLRDRLYDKPEHSGVMNYVRMMSMRKRPISVGDITPDIPTPMKRSTVLEPLPTNIPKKKALGLQYASKSMTGMSAREQNVLQSIVTRKRPHQLEPLDTSRDTGSTSSGGTDFDELDYDDGFKIQEAELMTELFSPTTYSETVSPSKTDHSSVMRRATGVSSTVTKSRGGQSNSRLTTTQFMEEEHDDDGDDDKVVAHDVAREPTIHEEKGVKSQGSEDIQDKSQTSSPIKQFQIEGREPCQSAPPKLIERSKSAGVDTRRSADSKKTKVTVKSQSTSQVSSKPNPGKVLSYLKKNRYDDKVPENTCAFDQLVAMRQALGWVSEIPRHGPDTREKMEKLKDIPEDEKEAEKAKEDTGEFFYCLPRNRNNQRSRYNPYDLQIVSANTARAKKMYFTISASYVTMCYETDEKMNESNATPALWWLWERRMFYMVFQYPVFVKFR